MSKYLFTDKLCVYHLKKINLYATNFSHVYEKEYKLSAVTLKQYILLHNYAKK